MLMGAEMKEALVNCPSIWRYVPLDGAKCPCEPEYCPERKKLVPGLNWPKKLYTLDEVCTKKKAAIGLHLGAVTQTAALDFDGPGSDALSLIHI